MAAGRTQHSRSTGHVPHKSQAKKKEPNPALESSFNGKTIAFLIVVSIILVFSLVRMLQLKTRYISLKDEVESLEKSVSVLREDNDAYYNSIMSGVDLNETRRKAMEILDMRYPGEEQVRSYTLGGS